ncbi:glycosyltransferase involved in cell wall biosynthesis [Geodermatophilus bullaregiensis]|uniref:glycosyltransferase family 2 protein n=1 Tax=Geodermatophilus bullaregiensis TaxID=1564160 RepID=UPI0019565F17|nr:glycosyltransferase [Geodermatophilus bullaregiensis]MBM7806997.1 glycosyltransferase involved in cell wall biosynthesis [Geodermatophilus bullaregiensis]
MSITEQLTGREQAPEGVYAVVWRDGVPIGDLEVAGDPAAVLPTLPGIVASQEWPVEPLRPPGSESPPGAPGIPATAAREPRAPEEQDVTIAVCTRDRPEMLRECLVAMGALERPVAEVLVIDNASADDRTRQVAGEFSFVRYVHEPRRGLDWARNRALVEARTAILAFTDDDVLVCPGWVGGLLRAFREEPEAVVVTGLVLPAELATPAQVQFEGRGGFRRGFRRRRFKGTTSTPHHGSAKDVVLGAAGAGANVALRRDVALEMGGFDVALDVGTPSGGGGDFEMFFRVTSAGHMLVYEPSAVVRHRHRPTMAELARQRRGDGTGNYSILLGAGSRYGRQVRREFLRLAIWWLAQRYARRVVCSVLWPRLWPPALVYPELRGVFTALSGRLYHRGIAQARKEALAHPDEPSPDAVRGL